MTPEPTLPDDLMFLPERQVVATLRARSAMITNQCLDAALLPGGDLMFVDANGKLCGALSPEFFALFGEQA